MGTNWEYGSYYNNYDMNGIIECGKTILPEPALLQVHDITKGIPSFLLQADAIISDPPANQSLLSGFYTKADLYETMEYTIFVNALFNIFDAIKPKFIALELFKTNYEIFMPLLHKKYKFVTSIGSKYYNNINNVCFFAFASDKETNVIRARNKFANKGIDEGAIIRELCKMLPYECICDPCMGMGLVGINCLKYGKRFVGTELNKKRLAVLLHKIEELEQKINAKRNKK